jgi:hypothetical protein
LEQKARIVSGLIPLVDGTVESEPMDEIIAFGIDPRVQSAPLGEERFMPNLDSGAASQGMTVESQKAKRSKVAQYSVERGLLDGHTLQLTLENSATGPARGFIDRDKAKEDLSSRFLTWL